MKRLDLGDLGAFARVYRSTAGLVRGTLARLGVRDATLDDATQDVFVVAYRRRGEFDPERPLEPWLVGIARRIAFRYRRTSARGQRKLAALQSVSPAGDADRSAATIDARRFLERFLDDLSDERRAVFVLGELYGLTGPEIAARLEIPVDTAYTRLRAVRRLLEQRLLAAPREPSSPVALHSGWLVLAPRLGESSPTLGGWLVAATLRTKVAAALLLGATVVAVPVLASSPTPTVAARPRRVEVSRPAPAPLSAPAAIEMAAPPPDGRLARALAGAPIARPRAVVTEPDDALGAAALAAAIAASAEDPAGALARLDRHAREFPGSALAQARSVARVRVLCRLGRVDEARAEADRLTGEDALVREALAGTCAG